jgi:hypothetical protein
MDRKAGWRITCSPFYLFNESFLLPVPNHTKQQKHPLPSKKILDLLDLSFLATVDILHEPGGILITVRIL